MTDYALTLVEGTTYNLTVENTTYNLNVIEGSNIGIPTIPVNVVIPCICNTPIGGGRVVRTIEGGLVDYASGSNLEHITTVIGITTEAVNSGPIKVCVSGLLFDSGWSWSVGPIYLGDNGVLTQTIPTTGFLQQVAVAIASNKIDVTIHPPTKL